MSKPEFLELEIEGLTAGDKRLSGLRAALVSYEEDTSGGVYTMPEKREILVDISNRRNLRRVSGFHNVDLPSRLCSPLISVPEFIRDFVDSDGYTIDARINPTKVDALLDLKKFKNSCESVIGTLNQVPIMELMHSFKDRRFMKEGRMTEKSLKDAATTLATIEIAAVARTDKLLNHPVVDRVDLGDSLLFINRIRALWSAEQTLEWSFDRLSEFGSEDFVVFHYTNDSQIIMRRTGISDYLLVNTGDMFMIIDIDKKAYGFAGSEYSDYFYSMLEIDFNMRVMRNIESMEEFWPLMDLLSNLMTKASSYKKCVEVSKSLETLLVMRADVDDTSKVVWYPVLAALSDFYTTVTDVKPTKSSLEEMTMCYLGLQSTVSNQPLLTEILNIISNFSGLSALEASTIHKFYYFSEIDEKKGLIKYTTRTCTKRVVEDQAALELLHSFRRQFIAGFVEKEKRLPSLRSNPQKMADLKNKAALHSKQPFLDQDLEYYSDVEIIRTIDPVVPTDPLYYAKDKRAFKPGEPLGLSNTINEIAATITNEEPIAEWCLKDLSAKSSEPYYAEVPIGLINPESSRIAKLAEKEKEQKLEGRLFGVADLETKVGLSMMSEQIKKVLHYITGNLMTPDNRTRNDMLHDASQKVTRETTWAFLADIEGHNQSMQHDNTSLIAKEISSILGQDNIADFPDLFRELLVFYPYEYEDKVHIVEHQHGGIEGWSNPFWTIVTMCIFDSSRSKSPLPITDIFAYSDDVMCLVEIEDYNDQTVAEFFEYQLSHAKRSGFTLKLSQTVMTKTRVTMLRRHYFKGSKADSIIKRLLAVSSMSESKFHSEACEAASICSSVTSSLEMSNQAFPSLFLKHIHLLYLTHKTFVKLISEPERGQKNFVMNFSAPVKALIIDNTLRWVSSNVKSLNSEVNQIITEVASESSLDRGNDRLDSILNSLEVVVRDSISAIDKSNTEWLVYSQIAKDKWLAAVLMAYYYTPETWGGLGVQPYLYQVLTGHSVSVTKSSDYLASILRLINLPEKQVSFLMDFVFGVDDAIIENSKEETCLTTAYPSSRRVKSITSLIEHKVVNFIKRLPINSFMKDIMSNAENLKFVKEDIMFLFRDHFHHRLTNLCLENSPSAEINTILGKVQTSRAFFSSSGNMKSFRKIVFKSNRENMLIFRRGVLNSKVKFSNSIDMASYFEKRNSICFPNIKFIEMSEPAYEMLIEAGRHDSVIAIATGCNNEDERLGFTAKKRPETASMSLYKGSKDHTYLNFSSDRTRRLYDFTNMIRWIIEASGHGHKLNYTIKKTNIYTAYQYILGLFGIDNVEVIYQKAISGAGGNVAHRLKGNLFQAKTDLHVYPNEMGSVAVCLKPDCVAENSYEDSNINFDLITKRLKLLYLTQQAETKNHNTTIVLSLRPSNSIRDVRIDWAVAMKEEFNPKAPVLIEHTVNRLDLTRMAILSSISSVSQADDEGRVITSDDLETGSSEWPDRVHNLQIHHYHQRMVNDGIILADDIGTKSDWLPFIRGPQSHQPLRLENNEDNIYKGIVDLLTRNKSLPDYYYSKRQSCDIAVRVGEVVLSNLRVQDKRIDLVLNTVMRIINGTREVSKILSILSTLVQSPSKTLEVPASIVETKVDLLMVLMLKYFPSFRTDGYGIMVDLELFKTQIRDCMNLNLELTTIKTEYAFVSLILQTVFTTEPLGPYLTGSYYKMLPQLDGITFDQLVNLPEYSYAKVINREEVIAIRGLEGYEYKACEILGESQPNNKGIQKLIHIADVVSQAFASVRSLASYTGSDSYVAQFGLLSKLTKLIPELRNMRILNACAGRGDGLFAADEIGLKMTSFARKDLFSCSQRRDDINVISSFDISDSEQLALYMDYDIVYMDISYIRGKQRAILGTITELLNRGKILCFRMNSLPLIDVGKLVSSNAIKGRSFILHANQGRLLPYQLYALLIPVGSSTLLNHNHDLQPLGDVIKSISQVYKSCITVHNFLRADEDSSNNSTNSLMPQLPALSKVINGKVTTSDLISTIPECKILTQLRDVDMLSAQSESANHNIISRKSSLIKLSINESKEWLSLAEKYELDRKRIAKRENTFEKARTDLNTMPSDLQFVDMQSCSREELNTIKMQSAHRLSRKLAIALIILRDFLDINDDVRIDESHIDLVKPGKSRIPYGSRRTMNMQSAIEHLAYGYLTKNMTRPIKLYLSKLDLDKSHTRDVLQSIMDFRRLSSSVSCWSNSNFDLREASCFLANFEGKYGMIVSIVNKSERELSCRDDDFSGDESLQAFANSLLEAFTSKKLNLFAEEEIEYDDDGEPISDCELPEDEETDLGVATFLAEMGSTISTELENAIQLSGLMNITRQPLFEE